MDDLYESKLGEIKTKKEWIDWSKDFYSKLDIKEPLNYFQRMEKVLGLTRSTIE